MNTDLMITVERVVRPLPCDKTRKNRMRADLYALLEQIYEEELARQSSPALALTRAQERFGEPVQLQNELLGTIPHVHRWQARFDRWITHRREGQSTLRFAVVFGTRAAFTLMLFFAVMIAWGAFYVHDPIIVRMWTVFFTIAVLFGVNCVTQIFCGEWALRAFQADLDHARLKKPWQLLAAAAAAGVSITVSLFVLLETSSPGAYGSAIPEIILLPIGLTMPLFLLVIWLMAKVELEDRRWSQLSLD